MGLPRQKRKNRSTLPRTKQPTSSKSTTRGIPQDALVASHWDKDATLSQNYRRLGLTAKLGSRAGGVQPGASREGLLRGKHGSLSRSRVPSSAAATTAKNLIPTEVKVRRDAKTGAIMQILHDKTKRPNPLGDLINEIEDEEEEEDGETHNPGGIVQELEEKAARPVPKRPRTQSRREKEWLETLVERYDDDYGRMSRDKRLNPMQQTEADIRRRVEKLRGTKSRERVD